MKLIPTVKLGLIGSKQRIFPAIIANNQAELDLKLKKISSLVNTVHLDVVDGKFAPNHSLDFEAKLNRNLNYNVHLMVKNPQQWIKNSISKTIFSKIDMFIPHFEEFKSVGKNKKSKLFYDYVSWMRQEKKKVAFALLPETKISQIHIYLKQIDYILILTVHPGFYGSKFLSAPLQKIKEIKKINPLIKVIVDGGITPKTIVSAAKAGADYFVSGSFVMKADNLKEALKELGEKLI